MKKTILAALLILLPIRSAMAITVDEVPNPQTSSGMYVQDSAGVLGSEYTVLIDDIAKKLKSATSAELAVVTVGDMGGDTVEDFAARLFKRFGIGMKGKDNGAMVLFSLGDRKVRIEVGYGLEGAINDAKAGRMLDTHAVPYFKRGEYGRGLFETSRALAVEIAAQSGAVLKFQDPASWPDQVTPPQPVMSEETPSSNERISSWEAAITVLIAVAGVALLGIALLSMRVRRVKARAAKEKAMRKGVVLAPVFTWFVAVFALIVTIGLSDSVFLPMVTFFAVLTGMSFLHYWSVKVLRAYIAKYRLPCPKCKTPMDLLSELADDSFLSVEEIAEEKAQGMDYEFWRCMSCDNVVRLNVKIGKASKCPECARLTLVSSTTVLKAATYSESGLKRMDYNCKNPKCGHHYSKQVSIPKKVRSSSGVGSSGRSSGGSFGGGSSGGGGSSRGW